MFTKHILGAGGQGGGGDYWIATYNKGTNTNVLFRGVDLDSSDNIYLGESSSADGSSILALDSSLNTLFTRKILISNLPVTVKDIKWLPSSQKAVSIGESATNPKVGILFNSSYFINQRGQFNNNYDYYFNKIAVDSSENTYVVGYSEYFDGSVNLLQGLLVKFDSSGTYQYDVAFRTPNNSAYFSCAAIDSSLNLWVGGVGQGNETLLVKYNLTGSVVSHTRFTFTNSPITDICADSSGNIFIIYRYARNPVIAKLNSFGTVIWEKYIIGVDSTYNSPRRIRLDSLGNIYVIGQYLDNNNVFITKLDSSGNVLWFKKLGTTSGTTSYFSLAGLEIDSQDNPIVCGNVAEEINPGYYDAVLAKLDPSGSGNGTHGPFTYQDEPFTVGNGFFTPGTLSYTTSSSLSQQESLSTSMGLQAYTQTSYTNI